MREFATGATRDTDEGKLDYEGFLSPAVERRFAQYMHSHRIQADGNLRDSDNWQKGIPIPEYMKSMHRHFMDLRLHHRGLAHLAEESDLETVLCSIRFNIDGYLHEVLKSSEETCAPVDMCPYLDKCDPAHCERARKRNLGWCGGHEPDRS